MNRKGLARQWLSMAGFSLVEVMIGGALLVGGSLAAIKIFSDQRSSQKRIELDRVLDSHMSTLKTNLAIKTNCNVTMGIPVGSTSAPKSSFPTTLPAIRIIIGTNTVSNLISTGDYINDQRTHQLSAIRVVSPTTITGVVRLEMDFLVRMFGNTVTRNVFVPIKFTGAQGGSDTYECMDDKMGVDKTLQKEGCEAIGTLGEYEADLQNCSNKNVKFDSTGDFADPANPPPYRCGPGQTITGMRPNGTVVCEIADARLNPMDAVGPGASGCNGAQARLTVNANNQLVVECVP